MARTERQIHYLAILKEAFELTWQKRYLWWFGFFVLLSSISVSLPNFSSRKGSDSRQAMADFFLAHRTLAVVLCLGALVAWLAFLALGILGRGALIKSINAEIENKSSNFTAGAREGKKYFWQIFAVGFLTGLFIISSLVVLLIPTSFLFYNHAYVGGVILALLAIAIFVPIMFIGSFMKIYGFLYVAITEVSVWDALENGYELVRKNIKASIIMALLLIVANIVLVVALATLAIPIAIIFFLSGAVLYLFIQQMGFVIVGVLALILFGLIFISAGLIFQVFSQAVFVLFFREIAKPEKTELVGETVEEKEMGAVPLPNPAVEQ